DPRYPNDTIYTTINQTMYATLDAADDLLTSLESIEKDIDDLKDQLLLRAELQTDDNGNATGQWICPDGYPGSSGFRNPSDVALETDSNGYPICGPASPARSQQIIASAEILKVQLLSIAQSAEARNLEVQAVGLMADNQKRRQ